MSEKLERPQLGEWCEVSAEAHRHYDTPTGLFVWNPKYVWKVKPKPMMYIGCRFVQDGKREWNNEDRWFEPSGVYTEVWLFVPNGNTNPIRVFPVHVKRQNHSGEAEAPPLQVMA